MEETGVQEGDVGGQYLSFSPAAMADDELPCGQPSGLEKQFVEGKQRGIRGLYIGGNGEANGEVNRANLIRESNRCFKKHAAIPPKIRAVQGFSEGAFGGNRWRESRALIRKKRHVIW